MTIKIVEGNLLESKAKYIVHQCNCVTWTAAHLAYDMFKCFPWADIYTPRRLKAENGINYYDKPGEIIVRGDGVKQRYVIAILGQYYPGKARITQQFIDSYKKRKDYFFSGLKKIAEIKCLESVAFPFKIGCGAAGGNWDEYEELIKKFAIFCNDVEVSIVKLSGA